MSSEMFTDILLMGFQRRIQVFPGNDPERRIDMPSHVACKSCRIALLGYVMVVSVACELQDAGTDPPPSADSPNILFIVTDDQRWDAVGYSGNEVVVTPTLDQLANEGVVFENTFVNTSICAVNRANLMIGQYPRRHGIDDFFKTFTAEQLDRTYPALMRASGYYTGFIGKWGIGHTHENTYKAVRIFDYWAGGAGQMNYWYDADAPFVTQNGYENYGADEIDSLDQHQADQEGMRHPLHLTTEIFPLKVEQFLKTRDTDKPFVLSLFFKAPHGPWNGWDRRFKDLYEKQEMPEDITITKEMEEAKPEFLRQNETMLGASTGRHWVEDNLSRNSVIRQYYRLVTGIDNSMRKIMELLERHGVADNTIIIYTSDNGFLFGEHGMAGKWLMREPSIRVPGFVFDPRLPKEQRGRRLKEQIITTDFTATLLDLADVDQPSDLQGRSIWPLVSGRQDREPWRSEWFYEHPYTHGGKIPFVIGVRSDRYKYTRYISRVPVIEEFFDLETDPHESVNLIDDLSYSELIDAYREKTHRYSENLR